MAASVKLVLILMLMPCLMLTGSGDTSLPSVQKKFEYKYSFKGPHLVQRDGTIPFWEHGGHAIASDESIRITPSLRSKKGHVWTKDAASFDNWEIEVIFRISGRGRVGADGLAIWFTEQKGVEGPVFGSSDKWKGLAVLFDSFDNDGQHNNPYIMAMNNDGNQPYDHNTDGINQQLGGCLRDFRNKPFNIRTKIEYYQNSLTIFFHNGMTNNKNDYELCMRVENVYLPKTGYFGISAATGGLADDHDVSSFLTHSLTPRTDGAPAKEVPEDDRRKYEQEFDEYHDKLQKAKDEYAKEHPDRKPEFDDDDDRYFEGQEMRELKQIFDGQNAIHGTIRDLNRKMDEIIGRSERMLSQLSMIYQAGGQPPPSGGAPPAQLPYVDTIKRHEVDSVLNAQRDMLQHMRDIRSYVTEVKDKVNRGSSGGVGGYDGTQHYNDVKNSINVLQNDVKSVINNKAQQAPCPSSSDDGNCVTPFYLFFFMAIQMAVFIGHAMYRSSKEAAAKKFY